jgi:type IV pilus assembly protein PilY1
MEFNSTEGGPVIEAVNNLTETRSQLKQTVNSLQPGGFTPLSETLFEAGQYLAGRLVDFGDADIDNRSVPASRIGDSLSGDRYLSPLVAAGQNNYIVLLTDGVPSNDRNAHNKIEALPGYAELVGESCNYQVEGDCLDKMANYLYLADLRDDLPGKQNVITHTIGFTTDFALLKDTAARGGGKYFVADNTATLTQALADLAWDFSRTVSLLTQPTIPVNNFNRTELINEVYLSLFEPEATHHWPGNLKKYQFIDTANGALLISADGQSALTPDRNFIDDSAVSLWSAPLVDGANVQLGGAASQLPDPGNRNLLTNATGSMTLSSLNTGNSAITATLLGSPEAERNTVILWARGQDVRDTNDDGQTTDPRLSMGDPLHVQPVIGEYGDAAASRNPVVFIATNDGYLHAIDAQLGKEIWSFIPQRLLKRLYPLSLDEAAQNKQYGLDGELVLITGDNGKPGTLLFGMRRGGDALYSMDVSIRTAPKLNWFIDSSMPDFLDMGQSWSPPVVRNIKVGSQVRSVAIFGGGYDPGQDNRNFRFDTKGNAIYFVDVETGEVIWSAGSSQTARNNHNLQLDRMNFAIPAGIRVIDQNQDGLADRMYVGDMGGQVWRFDIIPGNNPSSLVEGGVLASLGGADSTSSPPSATDLRRFYNTPDVVNVITDENIFLSINIGSGYRAHPLDTNIADEFFSIRDFHSEQVIPKELYASQSFPLITRSDLIDITNTPTTTLQPSDAGWRLGMVQDDGEKILGESLTIDNVLFFNSFAPVESVQSCLPGAGINRNYRVSIIDGSALTNLDNSADAENLTDADRFIEGTIGAPVSGPAYGPDMQACSGLDCLDGDREFPLETDPGDNGPGATPDIIHETYWYPVEAP